MRWVTYCSPVSGEERIGVIDESSVYGLRASLRLVDLLAEGPETFGAAASPHDSIPTRWCRSTEYSFRHR
jgi:hypothetical protein